MSFVSDFDAVVDCPGLSPAELGMLIYFFRNQGDSFLFIIDIILQKFDITKPTYRKLKKTLLERGFITSKKEYVNGRNTGCKITVLIENIKAEVAKDKAKKIEGKNIEGKNINLNNIDRNNLTHQEKGVKREWSKKEKGVKAAVAAEGDRLSAPAGAVASEAAPAAAAAADSSSPEISHSQDKKPRQSSKAPAIPLSQNPPSQADVEAAVSQIAANSKTPGWTPEAVRFKAFTIWNHYELKQWKRADGTDATDLNSCVFCWMKRDGFKPPVMDNTRQQAPAPVPSSGSLPAQKTSGAAEKQKSFKQMQQEWIERPLTDPEACAVEDAAHLIFNARSEGEAQGVLNSIPVHLRERALALANEKRKEQGDRPRIISPLPYEEDDS